MPLMAMGPSRAWWCRAGPRRDAARRGALLGLHPRPRLARPRAGARRRAGVAARQPASACDWWLRDRSAATRRMPAASGATSSRRSCACTGASATTSSACCSVFREIRAFHRGDAGRRRRAQSRRARSSGSTAWRAGCSDLQRARDLGLRIDEPDAPSGVPALPAAAATSHEPLVVARRAAGRRSLSFQVVPYGGDQRLMLVRDVSRQVQLESHAQGFRRQRLARAALAADRDHRLPRDPRAGRRRSTRRCAPPLQEMRRQAAAHDGDRRATCSSCRASMRTSEEAEGEPIDVHALRARCCARTCSRARAIRSVHAAASTPTRGCWATSRRSTPPSRTWSTTPPSTRRPTGTIDVRWWRRRRRRGALHGARHRHRHSGRAPAAAHRALLPRGCGPLARDRRLGARPRDRQARAAASRRAARRSHSTPGKGSTFTCRFPRTARAAGARTRLTSSRGRAAQPDAADEDAMETADLSHHISRRFNEDLERVRTQVLAMGGFVEAAARQGASPR